MKSMVARVSLIAGVLSFAAFTLIIMPAAAQEGIPLPAPAIDLPASHASSEVMVVAGERGAGEGGGWLGSVGGRGGAARGEWARRRRRRARGGPTRLTPRPRPTRRPGPPHPSRKHRHPPPKKSNAAPKECSVPLV